MQTILLCPLLMVLPLGCQIALIGLFLIRLGLWFLLIVSPLVLLEGIGILQKMSLLLVLVHHYDSLLICCFLLLYGAFFGSLKCLQSLSHLGGVSCTTVLHIDLGVIELSLTKSLLLFVLFVICLRRTFITLWWVAMSSPFSGRT